MRAHPTKAVRYVLVLLTGLLGLAGLGAAASEVRQPIAIQFALDRSLSAAAAPFVMADVDGLFGSEGLTVTTDIANGTPDAIARVAAGTSDFALVDINELIRFRGRSGALD